MRRGERKGSGDAARESGAKWGWGQEKEEEEEEELDRMNGGRILLVPKPQFAFGQRQRNVHTHQRAPVCSSSCQQYELLGRIA